MTVEIKHNFEGPLKHQDKDLEFNCTFDDSMNIKSKDIVWQVNGRKLNDKDKSFYKISEHKGYSRLYIKKPQISEDAGNISCQVKTSSEYLNALVNITCKYILFKLNTV